METDLQQFITFWLVLISLHQFYFFRDFFQAMKEVLKLNSKNVYYSQNKGAKKKKKKSHCLFVGCVVVVVIVAASQLDRYKRTLHLN